MTQGRALGRLKVLAGLLAFMLAALVTRLWFLQVLAAEDYRELARNNSVRLVEVPAPRGRILDANGDVLVGNRLSLVLTVNRQELGDRAEEVLLRLSELLGVSARELGRQMQDPRYYSYQPVPIARDVPEEVWYFIAEHREDFPGVVAVEVPVRTYPHGELAAHVLGYVGEISGEELQQERFRDYAPGDVVGKTGVEAVYERYLRGTKGLEKYLVNAEGETVRRLGGQAPEPGDDLVLGIDLRIQRLVERSLAEGMARARAVFDAASGRTLRADAGAALVVDPDTGAIVAMASLPSFDPRIFQLPPAEFERAWRRLTSPSANSPLTNRAIAGRYPPGSTFKPLVALAAMRHGIASPAGYYPCPPAYTVPGDPNTVFRNWTSADFGTISLADALRVSCDTVFYRFGYEFWQLLPPRAQGLLTVASPSREVLQADLAAFGFGVAPRLDLPGASGGRLPTARWKYREFEDDWRRVDLYNRCIAFWCPGDSINMAIGQGFVEVTPLQLAMAYAAVANGGRLCVPHVGLRVVDPVTGETVHRVRPRCPRRLPWDAAQLAFIRRALATVPAAGTAALAFRGFPLAEVPVAGKTGTAEVPGKQDFSWFAAMAPVEDPRYVVVVVVEQGGHGSTTAAPIARSILEGLFGLPPSGFVSGGVAD